MSTRMVYICWQKVKGEPKNVSAHSVLLDGECSYLSPSTENQTPFEFFEFMCLCLSLYGKKCGC